MTRAWNRALLLCTVGACVGTDAGERSDAGEPWAPPPPWVRVDSARAERFQGALEAARAEQDLPGLAIAIAYRDTRELWVSATGFSDLATETSWLPTDESRIGSVTKTFTAALVMQLVEEGSVSLDDPLEAWISGWPGWHGGPKIEDLLGHTSGIVSYNYIGDFDKSRPWTPEELVQWAYDHDPTLRFGAGTDWEYSNTNFILLGMIIEAVTGRSYAETLRTRLFEPYDLDMRLALSGDDSPTLVRCYTETLEDSSRSDDPTTGWAAGALVSTPADLARWIVALYGGELLSAASLERMTTPNGLTAPGEGDYGLATVIESDDGSGHTLVGHTGSMASYLTYAFYLEPEGVAVIVMSNRWETDLRAAASHALAAVLGIPYP